MTNFTDVRFMTADEKRRVATAWRRFLRQFDAAGNPDGLSTEYKAEGSRPRPAAKRICFECGGLRD